MKTNFLFALPAALLLFLGSEPLTAACDPNEGCHKCVVHNPFGGCVLYGNDPQCEIRKAKCQAGLPDLTPVIPNPTEVLQKCIQNPAGCPAEVIKSHPIAIGTPVFNAYLADLRRQASGRWRSLPMEFVAQFASSYPEVDLRRVRYANNIDTKHGQSMTLCYEVFLAGSFDDDDRSSLEHMLHELYHTVQCVNRGGVGPFVDEYLAHGAGTIIQKGSFDIHDDIGHERDAESRGRTLINEFGWPFEIENACSAKIRLLVRLLRPSGEWVTHGWYNFDPGEEAQLVSSGRYLHSKNATWAYYAEEVGGTREWSGDLETTFDGASYMAAKISQTGSRENFGLRLTCKSLTN